MPCCSWLLQVVGSNEIEVESAEQLIDFFNRCFEHRAVSSTKLNEASSRSHAIYSLLINRTVCDIGDGKVRGAGSAAGGGQLGSRRVAGGGRRVQKPEERQQQHSRAGRADAVLVTC
jgi:hypothetical protein